MNVKTCLSSLKQRYPNEEFIVNEYHYFDCLHDYKVDKIYTFNVFSVCHGQECDYIMKIQDLPFYKKELDILKQINGDIAPKLIDYWTCHIYDETSYYNEEDQCREVGVIISEKYDGDIIDLLDNNSLNSKRNNLEKLRWLRNIISIIFRLNEEYGIKHNDLFLGNIVYKIDKLGKITFKLIDFEKAVLFDQENPYTDIAQIIAEFIQYLRRSELREIHDLIVNNPNIEEIREIADNMGLDIDDSYSYTDLQRAIILRSFALA